jgi:hypothetical protein
VGNPTNHRRKINAVKLRESYFTQSRLMRKASVTTMATIEAPIKAMPNEINIVAKYEPMTGIA